MTTIKTPSASRFRFRAWNPETKQMIYPKSGDLLRVNNRGEIEYPMGAFTKCLIQWSTGLTDKNWTEIFEGDVLRIVHCWKNGKPDIVTYATVLLDEYSDCEYYVDYKHYGWILSYKVNQFDQRRTLVDAINNGGEVVGNVYEHPNLLTAK
jgi:uncharacterized phage protein (TIGR01671 family)